MSPRVKVLALRGMSKDAFLPYAGEIRFEARPAKCTGMIPWSAA
jgi:hypothetical protein